MDPSLTAIDILGPAGRLAKRLSGYEARGQQLEMAGRVEQALQARHHLLVEAGTGTGKSFAYLVPAILFATADQGGEQQKSRRVVVSTHTISLQEQLLEKDLPLLNSVIPREFSAVLVKGRSNYISLRRLQNAQERARNLFQRPDDFEELTRLADWAKATNDGSRADLEFRPAPSVWDEIASDSGNCLGRTCPTYKACFYHTARRRSQNAQILVVNHALFFSDLALRQFKVRLLPDYDAVILDEAHTVEDVASDHLGIRLTSSQVDYNLRRLFNDRTGKGLLAEAPTAVRQQVCQCRDDAEQFFSVVHDWLVSQPVNFNGRVTQPHLVPNELSARIVQLAATVARCGNAIDDEAKRQDYVAAADRLTGLANQLDSWLGQQLPDTVYWLERTFDRYELPRLTLAAAPLDVGSVLREQLFQTVPSVILTSATLTTGRADFGYFQSRLGLTKVETLKVGSPFDYEHQMTLIVVPDMPDPTREQEAYDRLTAAMIERYVLRTQGHAFALFTSYEMLRRAAQRLAPVLRRNNLALYNQAEGMPRHQMLERFKADPRGVLLGTDSFWQGVDVPGEALQNVIITKLPFSVPDQPLLQARLEAIRRAGGRPFQDQQLPEAIIKLRQGFGRLIRTRQDTGIVVILDPRVVQRRYGRQFLASLPNCRVVHESAYGPDQLADVLC
jgi:ATP-dependent DNA helicase DinG